MQISNAATGAVLDTETISSFSSGVYLEWAVSGNVLITITRQAGANAVLSGLFLDPAADDRARSFSRTATTQGNWIGTYGTQGYDIIGDAASLPSYATVTRLGPVDYTWSLEHDRPPRPPGRPAAPAAPPPAGTGAPASPWMWT